MTQLSTIPTFLRLLATPLLATTLVSQAAVGTVVDAAPARRIESFRPLASFNLPSGTAEIVDASEDGRTLVYTDAGGRLLGFVDITNPRRPRLITTLPMNGEPTSVAVVGDYAFAAVWTDAPVIGQPPPAFRAGRLVVVDMSRRASPVVVGHRDIGYHPDSLKAKRVGNQYVVVVAIENQPVVVENGLVTDEDKPGTPGDISPPGSIQVIRVDVREPARSLVTDVALPLSEMTAAGCLFPDDPQPEFVAWHDDKVAVSLQENNGIALLDMRQPNRPRLERIFSTGVVAPRAADLRNDARIDYSQMYPTDAPVVRDGAGNPVAAGSRMPDAIAFSPDGSTLYSADEGELGFTGGRGFSWWRLDGRFVGDDGGELESTAILLSHYPEARSAARGIEVEGVTTARFGRSDFAFIVSERGSFLAVYDIERPARPRLVQVLPTGISPEGVLAIPQRDLIVTADEVSGTLTLFQGIPRAYRPSADQPTLFSADYVSPFAAISGMCDGFLPGQFFAVPDNALPTEIYSIQTGAPFAPVRVVLPVRKDGVQARYDGEGICLDRSIAAPRNRGFWIASEGNAATMPNLLVQIDGNGDVIREIQLPNAIDAGADPLLGGSAQGPAGGGRIRSNGFEGITLSTDGRYVFAAIQREFAGEFATGAKFARIARYDLRQLRSPSVPRNGIRYGGDWDFFYFRFETNDPDNWPGLSEITTIGDNRFLVIERDKGIGAGSTLKRIYAFTLDGLAPDRDGVPDRSDTVRKILVRDVVDAFSPYEKIEALGVSDGTLWVGLDNDGGAVESRLRSFGRLGNPFGRR